MGAEESPGDHPAVAESAVIGVLDDKMGERPLVPVVLKTGYRDLVGEEQLRRFFLELALKHVIPGYGVPNRIVITMPSPIPASAS